MESIISSLRKKNSFPPLLPFFHVFWLILFASCFSALLIPKNPTFFPVSSRHSFWWAWVCKANRQIESMGIRHGRIGRIERERGNMLTSWRKKKSSWNNDYKTERVKKDKMDNKISSSCLIYYCIFFLVFSLLLQAPLPARRCLPYWGGGGFPSRRVLVRQARRVERSSRSIKARQSFTAQNEMGREKFLREERRRKDMKEIVK